MYAARCITAVLLFCGLTFAQASWKIPQRNTLATVEAKSLVTRYCQMDSDGFRLDPDRAARMKELTTWKTVPPVTRFDVISRFEAGTPKSNDDGFSVMVSYSVLGEYILGVGYTPDPRTVTAELQFVQNANGWKLRDSEEMNTPRIQRTRAYRWLREQIATAINQEARTLLEEASKQLQPEARQ
jgi:hypothetical protein